MIDSIKKKQFHSRKKEKNLLAAGKQEVLLVLEG